MACTKMHWREDTIYTKPVWSVDPDISVIEAISRHHLLPHVDISNEEPTLAVALLGEGSFNKAYTVDVKLASDVKSYIFRATLPVEPSDKVRSEVATLDYIKRHTNIPVPDVIAYDSSSSNALGFEWILMEKISGEPISNIWRGLSDSSKAAITRKIASYVLQMRKNCLFHEIGALYRDADNEEFTIGPIVTQFVFMGPRRQLLSRNRGPYHHDRDFVRALIDIQVADVHLAKTMSDEYLLKAAPSVLYAVQELLSLFPQIFPKDERNVPICTVLMHPDLSHNNIMIDPGTLQITGIIDWECTNASPLWEHPYPQCLIGPEVAKEANRVDLGDTDELRNELWDDWEKAQLRKVFDEVAGPAPLAENPLAPLKQQFLEALATAEMSGVLVGRWVKETREKLTVTVSSRVPPPPFSVNSKVR
jgi:Phosphotransferase enzyme family